jgi:hypothetical protein
LDRRVCRTPAYGYGSDPGEVLELFVKGGA